MDDSKGAMTCSKCGNKVDVNHKYCTRCGYITVYNEDIKNCDSGVVCGSTDNDVDDGKKDAIISFVIFYIFVFDYLLEIIKLFMNPSDTNSDASGFFVVVGGVFVIFPMLISCFFGSRAITKYDKYCINKSGSRKVLNIMNKISLVLMGLFFLSIIFMFLGFKFFR